MMWRLISIDLVEQLELERSVLASLSTERSINL